VQAALVTNPTLANDGMAQEGGTSTVLDRTRARMTQVPNSMALAVYMMHLFSDAVVVKRNALVKKILNWAADCSEVGHTRLATLCTGLLNAQVQGFVLLGVCGALVV
jgi:hypothetical protein